MGANIFKEVKKNIENFSSQKTVKFKISKTVEGNLEFYCQQSAKETFEKQIENKMQIYHVDLKISNLYS